MQITFTTETGTIYKLDESNMTWSGICETEEAGLTYKDYGQLLFWPDITIGQRAILVVKLFNDATMSYGRTITTSPVKSIQYNSIAN